MQTKELRIVARNVIPKKDLDREDRGVPGIYIVEVDAKLTPVLQANAVMDRFHTEIGVECLDHFKFFVFDPEFFVVVPLAEHVPPYSFVGHADHLQKIDDKVPKIFSFELSFGKNHLHEGPIASLMTVSDTKLQARFLAWEYLFHEKNKLLNISVKKA